MLQNIVRRLGLAIARRGLAPPGGGRVAVPGLREPVEVFRDAHGIPHIVAQSARDLFLAQGYVQAEDRLFQMDMTRRAAAGRLAEVLGDAEIAWEERGVRTRGFRLTELDYYLRILGMRRAAEASLAGGLGGEAEEALEAFADGVNAYIAGLDARRRPIEMKVLRYDPEPWRPADSLSVLKAMALELNFALRMKLVSAALRGRLGEGARLAALLPPEVAPGTPRAAVSPAALGEQASSILRQDGQFRSFLGWGGPHVGSNWLVLGPGRTTTGKPLLVNDPHLELRAPNIFHLAHLVGGPYDVIGAALPGTPGIILGHNRRIAWAITNVMIDDTDLYAETPHPLDATRYRAGEEWLPFVAQEEEIRVAGERRPRRRAVRFTRHGPIISDAFRPPAGGNGGGDGGAPLLAMRWTADGPSREAQGLLALNRARGWPEFLEACRTIVAPGQNLGYADRDGNIGYYCCGRIPIRAGGRSLLPADGARGEGEWTGFVPFEEQPHVFNPAPGYVATANNKPVDERYPYYISAFYDAPYRARRLHQIVAEKEKLSPEDAHKVPLDVYSIQAEEAIDMLIRPLEERLKRSAAGDVQVALNYLLNWDHRCTPDSIAASIFHVFYAELLREVFEPALGPELFLAFVEVWNEHCTAVEAVLADRESVWFAGRGRDAIVVRAFESAVALLEARLGKPTQAWSWGRLHRLTIKHPFHAFALARRLFDIGPFATGGSGTTLNNGQWLAAEPFEHMGGAGFRHVCDLGDLDAARWVMPGGESGNPASPHYADLARLWVEGKTAPMTMDRASFAGEPRQVLEPEPRP
jgi:penicillin amidase